MDSTFQLEKEAEIAQLRDKVSIRHINTHEYAEGILYTGQGRYARFPSLVNNRGSKSVSFRTSTHVPKTFNPLSTAGCFNCDDPSHVLRKCPKSLNVKKEAANKLYYFVKMRGTNPDNVHLVLADIFYQIDLDS